MNNLTHSPSPSIYSISSVIPPEEENASPPINKSAVMQSYGKKLFNETCKTKFYKGKKKKHKKPKDTNDQVCNVFNFKKTRNVYLFLPNSDYESSKNYDTKTFEICEGISIPYTSKIRVLNYSSMPDCIKTPCLKANITFKKKELHANIIWHLYPQYKMLKLIREMHPNQRYNHFPSTFELGRKDFMYRHHKVFKTAFPKDYSFAPETFILPDEGEKFLIKAKKSSKTKWIVKPVGLSRGRGVHILKLNEEFKNLMKLSENKHGNNYLLSKYISNPHLINSKKYDLRVYVLITSFIPLKIYMYREGLVRFATEDYKKGDYDNIFIHLTNYSINQMNSKYAPNQTGETDNLNYEEYQNYSKWSFEEYKDYFHKNNQDDIFDLIISRIKDVIVKTVITTVEKNISDISFSKKKCLYELYGFDILIDENFKAWLIEVNVGPSMHCSSPLDLKIKTNLFSDIINVVGLKPYDHYDKNVIWSVDGKGVQQKNYDLTKVSELKMKIYQNFQKDNLKFKTEDYDNEYYQEIINDFCEETSRASLTNFDQLFPRADNIEYYSKFLMRNGSTNDDNIVVWQFILSSVS